MRSAILPAPCRSCASDVVVITFPNIDPIALQLGPLAVHWYGLSYLAGIGLGWWWLLRQAARGGGEWSADAVADVVFYAALGAVIGGRLGYTLFYNAASYAADPWSIFAIWQGGMSFHGGLLGTFVALAWYGRKTQRPLLAVSDFVLLALPISLALGRIANFVNQELWGAPSNLPWAVVFTHPAAGALPRHPSQLYEALLEGLVLFIILNLVARRTGTRGLVSGLFLLLYGAFRSAVEWVREPDQHIGYLYGEWLTMGQVLSLPMIVAGMVLIVVALRAGKPAGADNPPASPLQ